MISEKDAETLFALQERYRVTEMTRYTCNHQVLQNVLRRIAGGPAVSATLTERGHSLEGRNITMASFGNGPVEVLLWSQMHGDEPTATLAIVDILQFLAEHARTDGWVQEIMRRSTVRFLPMLNPDGAERGQRQTAVHIDVNRDAGALASPEARILKRAHEEFRPAFGFNLHDQELSSAGNTPSVAAVSLLAPAPDVLQSRTPVRIRAMKIGAVVASSLKYFVAGHIATYADTHEPRAFGDSMQAWGTSTLLIESGHWRGDPAKEFIRRLNFVGILSALRSIAEDSFHQADLGQYENLQPNGKRLFDVILHGLMLHHPGGWSHSVDVGLMGVPGSEEPGGDGTGRYRRMVVKEIGDLSTCAALAQIEALGCALPHTGISIDQVVSPPELLRLLGLNGLT